MGKLKEWLHFCNEYEYDVTFHPNRAHNYITSQTVTCKVCGKGQVTDFGQPGRPKMETSQLSAREKGKWK